MIDIFLKGNVVRIMYTVDIYLNGRCTKEGFSRSKRKTMDKGNSSWDELEEEETVFLFLVSVASADA